MKLLIFLMMAMLTILATGCATGASDLKLEEVPKDNGVFFGRIDFYNSDQKIDGASQTNRCFVWFENEQGDTILKISMDESSWIFSSAPAGKIYLSYVICNAGFLASHPELKTRELHFPVTASNATYFGHLSIHFDYHGTPVLGMFGLIGAGIGVATSSGSRDKNEIKIDDEFAEGKLEYEKRYGQPGASVQITDEIIKKPAKPNPTEM